MKLLMQMGSLHYSNNITILMALECEVLLWDLKPSYSCLCRLGNRVPNLASIEDVQWHRSCVDFDFGSCSNMEKTWNCLFLAIEVLKWLTKLFVVWKEAKTKLSFLSEKKELIKSTDILALSWISNTTLFSLILM